MAGSEHGVVRLQLPEASEDDTRTHLARRFPGLERTAPPAWLRKAGADVAHALCGDATELSGIMLDLEAVPPFHRLVYEVARAIPRGGVLTYGEVARRVGRPGGARAVGQALARNPVPILVPCHRILAGSGRLGGFSALGGVATKLRLLALEGFRPPVRADLFGGTA